MATKCPFCGLFPYEMVDVGVGHVPVAVNCCEFGHLYFDRRHASKDMLAIIDDVAKEIGDGIATEAQCDRLHERLVAATSTRNAND